VTPERETKAVAKACGDLRADAARNRERILVSARAVFCAEGMSAPLERVAQHAGVGIATLYRRFPTREDLIVAAFKDTIQTFTDAVEAGLADPDPWQGFRRCLEVICRLQAADPGFAYMLWRACAHPEAHRQGEYGNARFLELAEKAMSVGGLRADFTGGDFVLLLMANGGVIEATGDAAPIASRRLVAYMIDAFASPGRCDLPAPPPIAEMARALGLGAA